MKLQLWDGWESRQSCAETRTDSIRINNWALRSCADTRIGRSRVQNMSLRSCANALIGWNRINNMALRSCAYTRISRSGRRLYGQRITTSRASLLIARPGATSMRTRSGNISSTAATPLPPNTAIAKHMSEPHPIQSCHTISLNTATQLQHSSLSPT